jgi:hypothetical protein
MIPSVLDQQNNFNHFKRKNPCGLFLNFCKIPVIGKVFCKGEIAFVSKPHRDVEAKYRSISSNILTATYGWPRINDDYAPLVKRIHQHTNRLSNACIPGTSMVDIFPILNYLPIWMAPWKRDALEWHERESKMFEGFNSDVAKQVVSFSRR